MIRRQIEIGRLVENQGQKDGLPANPRQWTREDLEKLKMSIEETPRLMEARGCIVYPWGNEYIVLGGNMRLAACRELGWETVPCIVVQEEMTDEKLAEIVLKDNAAFGAWDYDMLDEGWDEQEIEKWGVEKWKAGGMKTDLSGLPEELQGLDLEPDEMEDIQGDDEVARARVIITFRDEDRWRLEEMFGVRDITSKVVWNLEDIMNERKDAEE